MHLGANFNRPSSDEGALIEESWSGWTIKTKCENSYIAIIYEWLMPFATFILVGYASIQILTNENSVGVVGLSLGVLLTAFLWGAAIGFVLQIERGLSQEIKLDKNKRILVLGRRNTRGRFSKSRSIHAQEIKSAFILRKKGGKGEAILFLRLQDHQCLKLLGESEELLLPVMKRIIADLSQYEPKRKFSRQQSIVMEINPLRTL